MAVLETMAHSLIVFSILIVTSHSEEDEWADTYLSTTNISLALEMCEANARSLSEFPACFAYIRHSGGVLPEGEDYGGDGYTLNGNPLAIECGNEFGDTWAPDYQLASCCSGNGRYFVMTGQIGAFDWGWASTNPDARCVGYATGLAASICSPNQGKFIRDNTLYVCKSACDTMYEVCGEPGVNFPSDTGYTDGTTLCENAWGGWSSPQDPNYCGRPDGPFCEQNVSISVVDDDTDCLSFIRPNFDLSEATEYDYLQNKYCATSSDPNVDVDQPCNDIINALNRNAGPSRRLSSTDKCKNIPMYARNAESREIAIAEGCFSSASFVLPITFLSCIIWMVLF